MAESFASRLEHPVTVLIAEDEDLLRALLARTLWAEGYRTLEARDGGVALQLARQTYPHLHLVITDVVMPNVDGRQLGRSLAAECPGVPVIYISAYPPGDMFSRDAPASAAFLQKPFATEALRALVRSVLGAAMVEGSP